MKYSMKFFLFLLLTVFTLTLVAQPLIIFNGGIGNGYNASTSIPVNENLYKGGLASGYFSNINMPINVNLYKGGLGNGYASFLDYKAFIWTGTVGQSWTIPGNWNLNVVPTITRHTIIPSGVPAYPHINAGLFAIGDNPNNGAYKSAKLTIMPGALLLTRVNCKVENYGLINVEGQLTVRNSVSDAFVNKVGGQVIVSPTGLFIFQ